MPQLLLCGAVFVVLVKIQSVSLHFASASIGASGAWYWSAINKGISFMSQPVIDEHDAKPSQPDGSQPLHPDVADARNVPDI